MSLTHRCVITTGNAKPLSNCFAKPGILLFFKASPPAAGEIQIPNAGKNEQANPDALSTTYSMPHTYPKRFPEDGVTHKTDLESILVRMTILLANSDFIHVFSLKHRRNDYNFFGEYGKSLLL